MIYDTIRYMIWYIWYDRIYDMIQYGMIRYDIWYIRYDDMIWYMIRYEMIRYDTIQYMIYDMIWYDIWYDKIYMIRYMIWYDTIWYMINLWTAVRYPAGGSGRYSCTQIENKQLYTRAWGETLHKTIQKHRTRKIESKTYKTRKQTWNQ